jgi:hypothetical protein
MNRLCTDLNKHISTFLDAPSYLHFSSINRKALDLRADPNFLPNAAIQTSVTLRAIFDERRNVFITGPGGVGKCLDPETEVLMHNGSKKRAKDVRVDDLLMGEDSTPRKVLSICSGEDDMFELQTIKGHKFVCNSIHVLTLQGISPYVHKRNRPKPYEVRYTEKGIMKSRCFQTQKEAGDFCTKLPKLDIFDIPLDKYLQMNKQSKLNTFLYHRDVTFPAQSVPIDPWLLGYWLGDGCKRSATITTADPEIVSEFNQKLQRYKLELSQQKEKITYTIVGSGEAKWKHSNLFLNTLRDLNLIKNKHIPDVYKFNSREVRLQLLAGLIDSDGYQIHNTLEIVQKNKQLADDIEYLSASLGFMVTRKECEKSCMYKGEKRIGLYQRLFISGNGLEQIPVILARKKCNTRKQRKRSEIVSFKVRKLGRGPYCGWELDGNGRFLLGNFLVTHNTVLLSKIYNIAKDLGIAIAVTATTGAASICLPEGRTIHSFSGLKKGTIPLKTLQKKIKFYEDNQYHYYTSWSKIRILIIDEISMLGSQFLSKLDLVAKHGRRNYSQPFGGLQVIFAGDFLQLCPVGDRFAFTNPIWNQFNFFTTLLTCPYRQQTDLPFYRLLQRVRIGKLNANDIQILNDIVEKTQAINTEALLIRPTVLMSHHKKVNEINDHEFKKLDAPVHFSRNAHDELYERVETGDVEHPFKLRESNAMSVQKARKLLGNRMDHCAPALLQFKPGAQYILTFNLSQKEGYINGSRCVYHRDGSVEFNNGDRVPVMNLLRQFFVSIPNQPKLLLARTQYGLRLGYAATIHSAQGMNLDKAEIDLGRSVFAAAQTYVALSRLRSLNGLYLRDWNPKSVKTHRHAVQFYEQLEKTNQRKKIKLS